MDYQRWVSKKYSKGLKIGLVKRLVNRWSATSDIEVNVFYRINPLINYWLILATEWIATAPPRLLPYTTKGNFLVVAYWIALFKIAMPSFLIPASVGLP